MTPMMKDAQLKDLNNANLDKYNQQLKELCTKKGYHFVDVASAMKDSEGNLIPNIAAIRKAWACTSPMPVRKPGLTI